MNDLIEKLSHFLRVARAIAGVKGPLPVLAAITAVVAGVHCSHTPTFGAPDACTADTECDPGLVCYQSICFASNGDPCTTDADCSGHETCDTVDEVCVVIPAGFGGGGGAGGSGGGGGAHGTGGASGSAVAGTGGAKGSGGAGGGG
jgi:hypothetical protein